MKKRAFLSAALLILSLVLLFTGCEKVDLGDDTDTQNETTASTNPGVIFGKWYSVANQTVVVIPEALDTVTLYQLKSGYFEYQKKISGSCTYEDHILTMVGDDGKTYSWVFDAKTGSLSASMGSDTSAYKRCEDLPTEHVATPFPDLAGLNPEDIVTLGKYTDLTHAADCTAEAAISIFQNYYKKVEKTPLTITNRAAQRGDLVNIDYKGYLDGVAFSGGEAKSQDVKLIENSGYIPGFAEGVIGKAAGSTFDVNVTFPEDYGNKDLAGKAVVFTMTLNKIYDLTIPDADVATYTENKHTTYSSLLEEASSSFIKDDLWAQVLEGSNYENMPESFYGYFLAYYRDMYHHYAAMYGMDYNVLLTYYGISEDDFVKAAKQDALQFAVAFALSAKNNIVYTQDDFNAKIEEYAKQLVDGGTHTHDEAIAYINATELPLIKADLIVNTVIDWIYAQNIK
jgi:trigger factor